MTYRPSERTLARKLAAEASYCEPDCLPGKVLIPAAALLSRLVEQKAVWHDHQEKLVRALGRNEYLRITEGGEVDHAE